MPVVKVDRVLRGARAEGEALGRNLGAGRHFDDNAARVRRVGPGEKVQDIQERRPLLLGPRRRKNQHVCPVGRLVGKKRKKIGPVRGARAGRTRRGTEPGRGRGERSGLAAGVVCGVRRVDFVDVFVLCVVVLSV